MVDFLSVEEVRDQLADIHLPSTAWLVNEAKFYFQCYEHIYNNGDDAMLRADISVGALFLVALLIESSPESTRPYVIP